MLCVYSIQTNPCKMKKVLLMGDKASVATISAILFHLGVKDYVLLFDEVEFIPEWSREGRTSYFVNQKNSLFTELDTLIYVFDVESREVKEEMDLYQSHLKEILVQSPNTKVFCLVHNMDRIPEEQRILIFQKRKQEIERGSLQVLSRWQCFSTSIWDETLYNVWSKIFCSLLPNASQLNTCACHLAEALDANEVVLFERQTFLVIACAVRRSHSDTYRYEKICNIIKEFKLTCHCKFGTQLKDFEVRNSKFAAYIRSLTDHVLVLIVTSNSEKSISIIESCMQKSLETSGLAQLIHPSTVRSKKSLETSSLAQLICPSTLVQQDLCSAEQDVSVDKESTKSVGHATSVDVGDDKGGSNDLLSCFTKELDAIEMRIQEAKVLSVKTAKQQQEEFSRQMKLQQASLKKCIEDQESELEQTKKLINLQNLCIQKQFKELQQLKALKNEKPGAKLKKLATQKVFEERHSKLSEEFEQIRHDLEQRAELAEQRTMKLETQWVISQDEVTMTKQSLGKGGWGTVKVAKFRGMEVAAKMLHQEIQSGYYRELFIREMNMAAQLRHPNLVQFIGATIEGDMIILTELLHTTLRTTLEKGALSRQQMIAIGKDVCKALNYLHLMRPEPIVHRDVSSANILMEPLPGNLWKAKLTDYGSVSTLRQLKTQGPGNPMYSAPEANSPDQQSPKMDVFSFGVLTIEMCCGKFPNSDTRDQLLLSIKDRPFVKLIRKCLIYSKEKRPSIDEILADLTSF